jgi:hypothetical protein
LGSVTIVWIDDALAGLRKTIEVSNVERLITIFEDRTKEQTLCPLAVQFQHGKLTAPRHPYQALKLNFALQDLTDVSSSSSPWGCLLRLKANRSLLN